MQETSLLHERIKAILLQELNLDVPANEIDSQTRLLEELGLDSAGLIQLVVGLEEEFDVEIDESAIGREDIQDIASIATFVQAHMDGQQDD
ncbi:MAG: acyl carrier protein [Dehalococcoidia bacterium]